MKRKYKFKNLDCANCASKMEHAIKKLDGVNDININFMTQSLLLDAADEKFSDIVVEVRKIVDNVEPGVTLVP